MKRLLLLLAVLLFTTAPALAFLPPEELLAVTALYPEHTITDSITAGDDAFFLLQSREGVPSLSVLRRENGAWAEVLHSEKVISPARRSDDYYTYRYDSVSLAWDGTTLSLCYQFHTGQAWQHDFTRNDAGEWRFARLITEAATYPHMSDVLTYRDGCIHQTFSRRWADGTEEISVMSPCPMPWLAGCETLAGFDAAAFPMDVPGLSHEELSRVAKELLPGYTFVDGKFSDGAAFLMDKPTGERIFMGGECRDGMWTWVESQPLPEGTSCDSYHGSGSALAIAFPKPNASKASEDCVYAEWGDIPYNEYALYRQEGSESSSGSLWLICSILDEEDDWFHFESDGLYHNMDGIVFGEYLGERNVARVDWQTVPHSFDEALALMSRDWGVVGVDRVPLRSGPGEDMQELALCRYAAPIQVLSVHDGWAYVSVLNGELTGWLPEDVLLLGAEQLVPDPYYDDMWGFHDWKVSASYYAASVACFGGSVLLDAPDGKVSWEDVYGNTVQLVCECPDGWYLVSWPDTLGGGFIRAEFTTPEDEADAAPGLAREYFPDSRFVYGKKPDDIAYLLLDKPDGTRVLTCGVRADDTWHWTESTPLPEGTLLAVTEDENADAVLCLRREAAELCVRVVHERNAWLIRELQQDTGFNWMYTGGMLISEDGTDAEGLPGFDTDIRSTDWSTLPWDIDAALAMLIPAP